MTRSACRWGRVGRAGVFLPPSPVPVELLRWNGIVFIPQKTTSILPHIFGAGQDPTTGTVGPTVVVVFLLTIC